MTRAEDRKPILIVVAGANGSGKTTLTTQLLQDRWLRDVAYLNPDTIAQERFGGWNDPKAVLQAAQYVAHERERALAARESIAFETVFSAQDKLDYVRRAKQAGFFRARFLRLHRFAGNQRLPRGSAGYGRRPRRADSQDHPSLRALARQCDDGGLGG